MTVPALDDSPRRLFQQSTGSVVGSVSPLADPLALRQLVEALVQETLQREFTEFVGADPYERTDARQGVRNGTRPRTLVTRVGRVTLAVPRDRAGCFAPTVFARYQRHEQALLCTLTECYLQGVSTRKVRHVVETLCGETVSASLVSAATKRLDATLAAWRARRLDGQAMVYLIVDAHYERIRREGQVLSTAALWVVGVREDGYREHLGCWLGAGESTATWSRVFRDLAARGLHGVRYVVSDEHAGLRAALQRHCPDAVPHSGSWQPQFQLPWMPPLLCSLAPRRQSSPVTWRRSRYSANCIRRATGDTPAPDPIEDARRERRCRLSSVEP